MQLHAKWAPLGVSDFIKALASSKGSNSARRKSAFVTAAYKDEEVLKSYLVMQMNYGMVLGNLWLRH